MYANQKANGLTKPQNMRLLVWLRTKGSGVRIPSGVPKIYALAKRGRLFNAKAFAHTALRRTRKLFACIIFARGQSSAISLHDIPQK